jgi:diguanylate cyclase (GGDEF)-like protein/PAS domain S-box-containing protein
MAERNENLADILSSALSELDEGIAVLDAESRVLFWNPAATAITGYASHDLLGRTLPPEAYRIEPNRQTLQQPRSGSIADRAAQTVTDSRIPDSRSQDARPIHVELHHRQGHTLPAMLRRTPLRDALGKRSGTLLRFHPVEEIDALPHGAAEDDALRESHVEKGQAEMEDRLEKAWHEFTACDIPFGLLWVTVDQASMLRKTHGHDASEAMLAIIERTLVHGLRPAEILGRWGDNEFLILCHERTSEMLDAHAQHICSLAHNADFRWWGDRIPLTLSIGAAQAAHGVTLQKLLQQAQQAMQQSIQLGGDQAQCSDQAQSSHAAITHTTSTGGQPCSQS